MCTARSLTVSSSIGGGVCPLDAGPPPWMQTAMWTEGMTHICENITLPQTSLAGGKYYFFCDSHYMKGYIRQIWRNHFSCCIKSSLLFVMCTTFEKKAALILSLKPCLWKWPIPVDDCQNRNNAWHAKNLIEVPTHFKIKHMQLPKSTSQILIFVHKKRNDCSWHKNGQVWNKLLCVYWLYNIYPSTLF